MQKISLALLISVFVIVLSGYQSGDDKQQLSETNRDNIKSIVKGAVEDDSWLKAKNKKEVHNILGQYYTGDLLSDLTKDTWDFVKTNTDWYNIYKLKKITVKKIYDKNNVLVKAYIKEIDVTSKKCGQFTREYLLKKTDNGWRVKDIYFPE